MLPSVSPTLPPFYGTALGVFEHAAFAAGTRVLAEAIAASEGFSLAGGGDTLAAIDLFDVASGVSYISTGAVPFLNT